MFQIDRFKHIANNFNNAWNKRKLQTTELKGIGSFRGAVNQLNKFVPGLAPICFPLDQS